MDPDVLARYTQKVTDYCGGIDPYTLTNAKDPLPSNIHYFDICNYCIGKDSAVVLALWPMFSHLHFVTSETRKTFVLNFSFLPICIQLLHNVVASFSFWNLTNVLILITFALTLEKQSIFHWKHCRILRLIRVFHKIFTEIFHILAEFVNINERYISIHLFLPVASLNNQLNLKNQHFTHKILQQDKYFSARLFLSTILTETLSRPVILSGLALFKHPIHSIRFRNKNF